MQPKARDVVYMFTKESFIAGLSLLMPKIKVEIKEDELELFKVFSYGETEDKTSVGTISLAELKEVEDTFSDESRLADSIFFSKTSLEAAVRPTDRMRIPPYRNDRTMYVTSELGFNLEYSPASDRYIFALLCSFAQHPEYQYEIGALFRLGHRDKISSLHDLANQCRLLTVKISTPKVCSASNLRQMFDSYLFNISYSYSLTLSIVNFRVEDYDRILSSRRSGQLFPYRHYKPQLTSYYRQATATSIPFAQYLAFYHVAEYFFQSVSEQDTFQSIQNCITHPAFSPHKPNDIKKLYNLMRKIMREQRDDGVWNEKTGLLLCLKRYVPDIESLKESIQSIDSNALSFYKTNMAEFADDGKMIDFDGAIDIIYSSIRDRIYSVRNAIVHSKESEKARYEPFRHDKQLLKEIPLIRAVAEEIILNSAVQLEIYN